MKMKQHIFPVSGGSLGALSPLILNTITWHGAGDLVFQATLLAVVGGVVGYVVKILLDKLFKKT